MSNIKAEVNKIIFALTSVGLLILLIFPGSLSADHFRYGTMSFTLLTENGIVVDNNTITFDQSNAWTNTNSGWDGSANIAADFTIHQAADGGFIGSVKDYQNIDWGDPDNSTDSDMHHLVTSRSDVTGSTETDVGVWSGGEWTPGLKHYYADNGTFIVFWTGSNRESVSNANSGATTLVWRSEMMVRIGGDYVGNNSPVSSVPAIVYVQDNTSFTYQLNAGDPDSDNLTFRWGTINEFFDADGTVSGGTATFNMPTGMTLSASGEIKWDIRDNVTCTGCSTNNDAVDNVSNSLWLSVIMVEDRLDNGTAKSYIPIDFFFKVTSADNDPPSFTQFPFPAQQTVSVGSKKTFIIKSTDDSGDAPTITVTNAPSDNISIWSATSLSSDTTGNGDNDTTTLTINYEPSSSMGGTVKVVNIISTDASGVAKDKSLTLSVSSVANAAPTAPILLSPANGDNITSPVTFRFAGSTDSDGDNVSYTLYVCDNVNFDGCTTGTSVTAGGNFVPPFNQNFHDNLIPWPSPLYAATSSQQISQDFSMMPKWFIMLVMLGLLSGIISLSVKNITHRRIVFVLFLIIIGTAVSCMKSSDSSSSDNSTSSSDTTTPDTTIPDTTAPTVSSVSTTADNQSSVAITDNITVTFSESMDTTYVTTSTSDTYCSGTIRVSSSSDNFSTGNCVKMSSSSPASSNSNKTFTLDPYDNLTVATTYLTRVTTGVKDTAGNAMGSQYETSSGFTTYGSSITVSNSYSSGLQFWFVVASDPIGATAQSETWSFRVQ